MTILLEPDCTLEITGKNNCAQAGHCLCGTCPDHNTGPGGNGHCNKHNNGCHVTCMAWS